MPEYVADVSEFQQIIDFDAYKNAGFSSIIIRAGLGTLRKDRYFDRNWAEAKRVGLNRLAYWFNYPAYNRPEDEAALFNATVGPLAKDGTEGMGADCEDDPGARRWPADGFPWMRMFLDDVGPADYPPPWYASPSFVRAHNLAPLWPTWPYWVANYGVNVPDEPVPASLWQFTSRASVAGISGNVDMSVVLRGSFTDLLYGGSDMLISDADKDWLINTLQVPVRQDIAQVRDELIAAINALPAVDPAAVAARIETTLGPLVAKDAIDEISRRLRGSGGAAGT